MPSKSGELTTAGRRQFLGEILYGATRGIAMGVGAAAAPALTAHDEPENNMTLQEYGRRAAFFVPAMTIMSTVAEIVRQYIETAEKEKEAAGKSPEESIGGF